MGMAPEDIILRGKNNSSITIKTDLIDVDINAGGIVGNLGGNYTFEGEDILVARLDIVGIVDPTGVADVAAVSIEAKNGNRGSAIMSGLGVVPLVGFPLLKNGYIDVLNHSFKIIKLNVILLLILV